MHNMYRIRVMDRFSVLKVQMTDSALQNDFHMNILDVNQIWDFLTIFVIDKHK
jgi:hypothetical protein